MVNPAAEFTSNWFAGNEDRWLPALRHLRDREIEYLEIGSHEGRSALFVAENFPRARLTCIDLWAPSPGSKESFDPAAKERFDRNLSQYSDRVRTFAGRSTGQLDALLTSGERFDVIYIDGAHDRTSVFVDSAQAWPLLNIGGVMIWDDYTWKRDWASADRPKAAIDTFLYAFASAFVEIERSTRQVLIRKTKEWPNVSPPVTLGSLFRRLKRHLLTGRI